jgi:hypothetical protein
VRPIDVRPADSPGLPDSRIDSEDERGGIGENFCQPPLSRAGVEPPELPDLGADPEFELPRVSEFLPGFWPKRWDPLLESALKPAFELPFPGRETSRLFPADLPFVSPAVPRAEKKC